jgi:hypothetical protein
MTDSIEVLLARWSSRRIAQLFAAFLAVFSLACGSTGDGGNGPRPRDDNGRFHAGVNVANVCPVIETYLLLPHAIEPDSFAEISVRANDPDGDSEKLGFSWRATSGTFTEQAAPRTHYHCADTGNQRLTLQVRDSDDCQSELALDVTCLVD